MQYLQQFIVTGHASGEYEDFMTGFVVDNGHVWGRPVGVTVAPEGSLLVTDDASKSIWEDYLHGKSALKGKFGLPRKLACYTDQI